MRITVDSAIRYLGTRGVEFIDQRLDDGFVAVDISRRNRNLKVFFGDGTGLFVKQPERLEPARVRGLRREAYLYRLIASDVEFAGVRGLMPRLCFYDDVAKVLVLHLIRDGESLHAYRDRSLAHAMPIAAELGRALAELHRAALPLALRARGASSAFDQAPPWVLSIGDPTAPMPRPVSGANAALLCWIRRERDVADALTALRDGWRLEVLIHGDLKWDNCVLTWRANAAASPRIAFVDWELADIGDGCWDVGMALQPYVARTLARAPIERSGSDPRTSSLGREVESAGHAGIACWERYADDRGIPEHARPAVLDRCARFAGARMLQAVYESTRFARALPAFASEDLGVGRDLLVAGREALLGLLRKS